MRITPAALAAAAILGCAMPSVAQKNLQEAKEKQAARESAQRQPRASSAELDQARVDLKHAELDVMTTEEGIEKLSREVAELKKDPEAWKTGGGRAQQATLELYQEQQRLQQFRATLAHRKLDVAELERRADETQRAGSLTIEFPGGSVNDFIGALSQASGSPVNVIVGDPQIASAPMGPVRLRGVTVETAVRVIPSAAAPRPNRAVNWDVSRIDDQHGAPVFRIRQLDVNRNPDAPIGTDVISLAAATSAGVDVKAVLSAVDAALAMLETADTPPDIKYHPESGILIVRGTSGQVSTIREVVSQIGGDAQRKAKEGKLRMAAKIEAEVASRKLQIAHDQADAELRAAEDNYKDMLELQKAGNVPAAQVRDAELMFSKARAQRMTVEAEMAAAEQQAQLGAVEPQRGAPVGDLPVTAAQKGDGDRAALAQMQQEMAKLREMLEDYKSQNEALQQQVRALQAEKLKKDKAEGR